MRRGARRGRRGGSGRAEGHPGEDGQGEEQQRGGVGEGELQICLETLSNFFSR